MKLNVLYKDGTLKKGVPLKDIEKGLTWDILNNVRVDGRITKEEAEFLEKHGLKKTIFNVSCLKKYGCIQIPDGMLKYLKNVKVENEQEE